MMGAWCSLLTPRLSPKAECCGTAPCGDGGGTFCVCWLALAAYEGCTMSRGSLLAHGAPWGGGLPKITNTPSLVPQDSCMWPMWQKEVSCPCSSTLSSLSPLQMARAKPTAAPSPPPAGDNPERVFLEITLQGMAQARGVVRAPACPRERGQGDKETSPGAAHQVLLCWARLLGRAVPWGQSRARPARLGTALPPPAPF